MIWNTWSDFFAMGGYGPYVWGSCVVVAGCMAVEVLALRARMQVAQKRYGPAAYSEQPDSAVEQ